MHEPTIKVRHAQPHERDASTQPAASSQQRGTGRPGEQYARESFTLRRMKPWQIAALAVAALVLVALALMYM